MSLVVAGEGTWLAGNNAALTPTIPSGGQSGDTVVCIGYVRENGATLGISGGSTWTQIGTHASPANEMRASVWYAAWTSGLANPTVTPSGSGSNDTTLATCILLRGQFNSTTLLFGGTVTTTTSQSSYQGNALVLGDSCLTVSFVPSATEAALTMYAHSYVSGGMDDQAESTPPQRFWTNAIISTSGADSSAIWGFVELPVAFDGTNDYLIIEDVWSASGNQLEFRIKFNSTPPVLPPSITHDAIIDLVIGWAGSLALPKTYEHALNIDLLVGFSGNIAKVDQRSHVQNIDLLVGGECTVSWTPAVITEIFGVSPAWNSAAQTDETALRDWIINVTIDGVPIPATSVTIRRSLGMVSLSVNVAGFIVPVAGALLSVNVFFRDTAMIQTIDGYVTQSTYAKPTSVILASRTDQQSYGVAWSPSRITYRSNSRIRTEVDWFVRPGDLVNGVTINDVVTVLGGKSWMTEVGYG